MIFNEPSDWNDLQNKVGELLAQCGLEVEIEKKLPTARGVVEIDIFAEEVVDGRKSVIICECKNWRSPIPQTIVHAFRSVVADSGANVGYVITTSDFQSGSYSVSEKTNIQLLKWSEFQRVFFSTWYSNYFMNEVHRILRNNFDDGAMAFFDDFEKIDRSRYQYLQSHFRALQEIKSHLGDLEYDGPVASGVIKSKLPLVATIKKDYVEELEWKSYDFPEELMTESSHGNFLLLLKGVASPIYAELNKLDLLEDSQYNW